MGRLILKRGVNETIVIGDEAIVVQIVAIQGGRVKVSIECPKNISVHRGEIYKQIKARKESESCAASTNSDG